MASRASEASRFAWLDTLRLLAGICIVAVHSTSNPAGNPFPNFPEGERIAPILFRSIVYIARTELFLIISVFLLMMALDRRPRSYGTVIREQARRLLVPFAFWVVVYAFYRLIKAARFGYAASILTDLADPWSWAGYLLLGNVQYHMHFLPTLFGMILLFPAYRLAVRLPILGVSVLIFLSAKLVLDQWVYGTLSGSPWLEYVVRLVKILTYGGYGILAASFYGILKRDFDTETGRQIFGVVLLLGAALFMVKLVHAYQIIKTGTWVFTFTPGYWADYLMPPLLFLGIMSMRHLNWPPIFSRLAPFSFGIYLMHPLLMDLVEIMIAPWNLVPWQMVSLKFPLVLVSTVILVMLVARLPFLSWTIGLSAKPARQAPPMQTPPAAMALPRS
ncbi:acyltransferase [Geminicoccus roseus]|uniref:acyltransferase n=1 Tax=Geminicoccus roseus TaxID=404900 RepID=UPI0004091BA1|nr:acyltransferase [Geminicoccus roseus]